MAAQRTQKCGAKEEAVRLSQAQKFPEIAELVTEDGISESASVAAALAVLAGIAASDAACCRVLGRLISWPSRATS